MKNRLQKIEKAINSMSDDRFNELLNDLGVNEEKRWVPRYEEWYWSIMGTGKVYEFLWTNSSDDNYYYMYHTHVDGIITANKTRFYEAQGTTYTTNMAFLENLIKNEPERVKKYLFGIE